VTVGAIDGLCRSAPRGRGHHRWIRPEAAVPLGGGGVVSMWRRPAGRASDPAQLRVNSVTLGGPGEILPRPGTTSCIAQIVSRVAAVFRRFGRLDVLLTPAT